jgi:prepilin-type processing-associated H-X9-DG protein/prepilin-type N-terminal cleavage/methylation domain-containing protein
MKTRLNTGRSDSALTLVELLVVIAIIGILAVLLLPVISKPKQRAEQIQCVNNVRQLGLALQMFKADHNYYPPFLDPADHTENRNWQNALGYEMDIHTNVSYFPKGVWHCPAANRPSNAIWNLHPETGYDDYGYNANGLGPWVSTNHSLGLANHWLPSLPSEPPISTARVIESEVVNPSEMFAVGDAFLGSPSMVVDGVTILGRASDGWISSHNGHSFFDPESTKRSLARHQGKANVVFCDGHVESPMLKFLFEDTSDAALSRWNRDHLPHREKLTP